MSNLRLAKSCLYNSDLCYQVFISSFINVKYQLSVHFPSRYHWNNRINKFHLTVDSNIHCNRVGLHVWSLTTENTVKSTICQRKQQTEPRCWWEPALQSSSPHSEVCFCGFFQIMFQLGCLFSWRKHWKLQTLFQSFCLLMWTIVCFPSFHHFYHRSFFLHCTHCMTALSVFLTPLTVHSSHTDVFRHVLYHKSGIASTSE